jgi:hypothetical protein
MDAGVRNNRFSDFESNSFEELFLAPFCINQLSKKIDKVDPHQKPYSGTKNITNVLYSVVIIRRRDIVLFLWPAFISHREYESSPPLFCSLPIARQSM